MDEGRRGWVVLGDGRVTSEMWQVITGARLSRSDILWLDESIVAGRREMAGGWVDRPPH